MTHVLQWRVLELGGNDLRLTASHSVGLSVGKHGLNLVTFCLKVRGTANEALRRLEVDDPHSAVSD